MPKQMQSHITPSLIADKWLPLAYLSLTFVHWYRKPRSMGHQYGAFRAEKLTYNGSIQS
jgi:hypothetical protein